MTDQKHEAVARAICGAGYDGPCPACQIGECVYFTDYWQEAAAAIAAYEAVTAESGMVMVPRILTQPMLDAYMHAFVSAKRFDPQEVWSAMIEAAPPAAKEPADG